MGFGRDKERWKGKKRERERKTFTVDQRIITEGNDSELSSET